MKGYVFNDTDLNAYQAYFIGWQPSEDHDVSEYSDGEYLYPTQIMSLARLSYSH